jgi:hypothetical protein
MALLSLGILANSWHNLCYLVHVHGYSNSKAVRVMPRWWWSLIIVAFWLITSAIFFRHEWWPYLEPDAPPPFAIDLEDEARFPVPATWKVFRNGNHILMATTKIAHNATENTFTLSADFKPPPGKDAKPQASNLTIQHMTSQYRVTPEGQLLHLEASVAASYLPTFTVGAKRTPVNGQVELSGDVKNGRFSGKYHVELENVVDQSDNISVPVSSQGSVLIPLHPVKHIRGLQPGQTWRLPVIDPLDDLLAAIVPGGQRDPTYLNAKVLPESRHMTWGNQDQECLVIEYSGEEMTGRTWVRRSDALVLEQEVTKSGDTWILRRE